MGFRYRKSLNLGGGFRINISKSGIGYSWGTKGYRVTKTAKGTTRRTVSIPGTGISFSEESGKKNKDSKHPSSNSAFENNYSATTEIVNSSAENMVSDGMEDLLSTARKSLKFNKLSTICIWLFLLLSVTHPIFILLLCAAIGAKIYVKHSGLINLEYSIDKEQNNLIKEHMAPLLKITDSEKVWRIMQSSKVIDKKYSAGATESVNRIPCTTSKRVPFPFKSDTQAACFKTKKETLVFLPDKLFVIQKNNIGALSYSDISNNVTIKKFIEDDSVPKDTEVIEHTWKYINKTGGPDKRFSNNKQLPVCLYGKLELTSTSGLNTIIMFSNPHIQ